MTVTKILASDWMQTPQVAQSGASRLPCSHAPYGHRSAPTGAPDTGLTGQRRETGLGWYLLGNGHRCYSPVLMRFHSPDLTNSPWSGGGVNSYVYCQGDPINFHDRSGRIKGWANSTVNTSGFSSFSTVTNTTAGVLPAFTALSVFAISKINSATISRADAALLIIGGFGAVTYAAGKLARHSYDENVGAILEDVGTTIMNTASIASAGVLYKTTKDANLENLADQHLASSLLSGSTRSRTRNQTNSFRNRSVKMVGGTAAVVASSSTSNSARSSTATLSTPGFRENMASISKFLFDVAGVRSNERVDLDNLE